MEVDAVMKEVLSVLNRSKLCILLVAVSRDCGELLIDMEGHFERVLSFLQAVRASNLNCNLGFHSDCICAHCLTEFG